MSIIISKDGKDAQRVSPSSFDKEDYLQQYITNNPDSVPVYEIDEDIRLLILAREFVTNSGPIDALGIDQNGNIYLVETKLYKNTDKRTVMAQVLDYGAALWASSLDFNDFANKLDEHVRKEYSMNTRQKVQEFFSIDDDQYEITKESMQNNLNDGRFKFVVLMDELHDRLKDLIRFINRNSQFDTYAVELDYYKHESFEIIIPKMYGTEVKKEIAVKTNSTNNRRQWDESSFMQQLADDAPSSVESIKKLYEWSKINSHIKWGNGAKNGSFNPLVDTIHQTISVISVFTNGSIHIKYNWFDPDIAIRLRNSLAKNMTLEGVTDISDEQASSLTAKLEGKDVIENIDKIIAALEDFINQ